jgi:hypothetical protein
LRCVADLARAHVVCPRLDALETEFSGRVRYGAFLKEWQRDLYAFDREGKRVAYDTGDAVGAGRFDVGGDADAGQAHGILRASGERDSQHHGDDVTELHNGFRETVVFAYNVIRASSRRQARYSLNY